MYYATIDTNVFTTGVVSLGTSRKRKKIFIYCLLAINNNPLNLFSVLNICQKRAFGHIEPLQVSLRID
jgi:hypothetical protein